MRRRIGRRGRKIRWFDSRGFAARHFFGCLPLGFVREGSVTRLDGCDCALASGGRVASMSDSRPELMDASLRRCAAASAFEPVTPSPPDKSTRLVPRVTPDDAVRKNLMLDEDLAWATA